ncbi:MAG: ABC transporter substrate-binding protein, partial [Candidatus Rokubacteria bacterium]|nr:ABC transporter substrate-binding protein [Candidatus Rokubacteria bacterium]
MTAPRPVLILMLALLAAPLAVEAQPAGKVYRIGALQTGPCARYANPDNPVRRALHELGYVAGQNLTIECRSPVTEAGTARVDYDRLPDLAAELVRLNVDVLVTLWNTRAAFAAKNATNTIPIVMVGIPTDPVRQGLVASLAKPGGNLTGIYDLSGELDPKRLELLKEAVPEVSRVGILFDEAVFRLASLEEPARILGLQLTALGVRRLHDFEGVFQIATRGRVGTPPTQSQTLLGTGSCPITGSCIKNVDKKDIEKSTVVTHERSSARATR